jgi:hypothetical protein
MAKIIAYCANPSCGLPFETTSLIEMSNNIQVELRNVGMGDCPRCGSVGRIQNGLYEYFDDAISLIKNTPISIDKLRELEEKINELKASSVSRQYVIDEVKKISQPYASLIEKAPASSFHNWIATIVCLITVAILIQQTYFKGNDNNEIKNKIIEYLMKENVDLKKKSIQHKTNEKSTQKLTRHKIGRNDPCRCGSGKKYKKCCLK